MVNPSRCVCVSAKFDEMLGQSDTLSITLGLGRLLCRMSRVSS